MSCVGFYIHRGDSGEQWYLKIESTGGLLEKVLMCELPTGDGRKETRCIETQALQLIHCHRRPPRGIADYHHLRPIHCKLLHCNNQLIVQTRSSTRAQRRQIRQYNLNKRSFYTISVPTYMPKWRRGTASCRREGRRTGPRTRPTRQI